MKKILKVVLCISLVMLLVGCGNKQEESTDSNLVTIDKIYYQENDNGSSSMYLVYSIKSDEEKDITAHGGVNLVVGENTKGSAFFTYDTNKNVIEEAGFPTVVSYKTLYAGSNQTLKYIATFTVSNKVIENNEELKLIAEVNGHQGQGMATEYDKLEKTFTFKDVPTFKYSDNQEFVQEFQKDYN